MEQNCLLTLFRVLHGRTGNFRDFFVNISTLAKARVEILTKKSRNPLRKWISLKFPVLPCSTLERVNKQLFPLCSSVIRRLDPFLRLPLAGGPGYLDRFSRQVGNLQYFLRSLIKYDRHFSYWILNPCSQPALGDFPFFCCNHCTNFILDLVVSFRYLST